MSNSMVLASSLASLFFALLIMVVLFLRPTSPEQAGLARSLTLVEEMGRPEDPTKAGGSLFESMFLPVMLRLSGLGRRLSPDGYVGWLQGALDRAGNPRRWNVDRVLGAKAAGLLALGALGLLYGGRVGVVAMLLIAGLGGAAGFFLPDLLVYNSGLKRQEQIRRSLAEVMDMLTVCVEAGLGFDAALTQVARKTDGPLAAELVRVLQEMQLGTSRVEALQGLAARGGVPDLQSFVSAVVQADSLGIPIANILREQAKEMRTKRRQRAEEKAQQVPIKVLFPMLFFIFPALFVVVIGPGAIQMYHTFTGT